MHIPVVAVEGIIGAGKSTFCERAGRELNLAFVPEPVEENPYLDKFYAEPARWALHMQMWLVSRRVQAMIHARDNIGTRRGLLVDRSILGDRVFAEIQKRRGNISREFWPIYSDFFSIMTTLVPPPDVLVFLNVTPTQAQEHMMKRGRASEMTGVTVDYQQELHAGYTAMIDKLCNRTGAWQMQTAVLQLKGYMTEDGTTAAINEIGATLSGIEKRQTQYQSQPV